MNKNRNQNSQWGVFASGLALGGIIGAGVALLLAPRSGEDTRSVISDKGNSLKDQLNSQAKEFGDRVQEQAQEQIDAAKKQFEAKR